MNNKKALYFARRQTARGLYYIYYVRQSLLYTYYNSFPSELVMDRLADLGFFYFWEPILSIREMG